MPAPERSTASPRAARTRAALLAAGVDLLSERSIDAIAIDELVAAAGVAKGSFFNHFADKHAFGRTIAEQVRADMELRITATNDGVADPLARLAGGMIAAAAFAMAERKRMAVLAGAGRGMIDINHPLNDGVRRDMAAGFAAGEVRAESVATAALFWLGCCQTVVSVVAEQLPDEDQLVTLIGDMLMLGLRGLGVSSGRIAQIVREDQLRDRLR